VDVLLYSLLRLALFFLPVLIHSVTLTIRKLEQEILAAGHDVCILSTVSGDPANTNLEGTHPNRRVIFLDNAIPIPFLNDPNNPDISYQLGFAVSPSVLQELEAFDPSIIHITCPDCTALHLIQYARSKEIPVMGTYHSNIPEYMAHYPGLSWLKHILGHFFRHQYNFLQALYVPTPFIQKHLVDEYKMDRATTLGVWGRGVDTEQFSPRHRSLKFRGELGVSDDIPVVVWVGRLVPEKRVDIFADTVRRLAALNVPFHAVVVGAGPAEDEIRALPHTTFKGWMNASQLAVAYASSDIFLFPSSVETFGNVTLEAMASGLPVVVESGCSGHLVRDGENGFACQANDADSFFEATLELVTKHNMRRTFAEKSRELSMLLDKHAVVRKMLDNYSTITDEFYVEYRGHHANRDVVYRQPDSFVGGNHPRPLLLVMVEKFFFLTFFFIWNMTSMFVFMQESVIPRRSQQEFLEMNEVQAVAVSKPLTKPLTKTLTKKVAPSSSTYVDQGGDGTTVIEFTDVNLDPQDPLASDDATASTADSSQEMQVQSRPSPFSCIPGSGQVFGDCELSHTLAKGFVDFMAFQMRMESNLRNFGTRCLSSTVLRRKPKRKNSFSLPLMDVRPEVMMRTRSDTTDASQDSEDSPVPTMMMVAQEDVVGHHQHQNHRMRSRIQLVDHVV
jgi:phosphatidylinositol alpha 1,6-mannosyltransferase